jgi:trigger factor
LNIQTERLDNHTARLTVEVEQAAFEQAKQKAARKLSNKVNLPGFRKGKAPYHIVVRFIGEAAIVEEAVELLSNDLYPAALKEANLDPYGPGAVEDFTADPIAIVYSVPLAPSVDLKDYRGVRLPYATPTISDRDVERGLKRLREREAEVEPMDVPAEIGSYVTLDIHSHIHGESEGGHDGENFIHEHSFKFVLDENDDLLPGFSAQLVGAAPGDKREFELTIPADSSEFPNDQGKTVHFEVGVSEVAKITLPDLDDAFADRIMGAEDDDDLDDAELADDGDETADGNDAEAPVAEAESEEAEADEEPDHEPYTLAQLRLKVREDLERASTEELKEQYAANMLQAIVEQADVRYPEAMIADQVQFMLERMDQQLRQQRLNLEDYKRLLNKTDEDLFADYRDPAISTIRRSLVRRELFDLEQLTPTDADMDAEFDRIAGPGNEEQRAAIRSLFEAQGMGDYLREQLAERKLRERLIAIGTGEAPVLTPPVAAEAAVPTTEAEEETT